MLQQADYNCIGDVAKHCDNRKLCIAEQQATDFDVSQLYCNNWIDILTIWNEIVDYQISVAECEADTECTTPPTEPNDYELKLKLIEGGSYTNCNNKEANQQGVKRVLIYYSYARYKMLSGDNDTASGTVTKTNEYSIPKTQKELEQISDQYRNMGLISYENTIKFLCANKDTFTWFDNLGCKYQCNCDCNNDCGSTKAKGYGFRSTNISKG